MAIVGLFYGSDTGNTENIAKIIQKQLGSDLVDIRDIAKSTKEDIEAYDFLIIGIPTWYYGEAQCDWDDFFPTLEEIDFTDKLVAIYGCGDQEEGYTFEVSQALVDDNTFVGLCIDEDRQPELTAQRVEKWVKQVYDEMCLAELA